MFTPLFFFEKDAEQSISFGVNVMQVIVDEDYIDLIINDDDNKNQNVWDISPFTGKRVPTVSLDEIKKLLSSPKDKRLELLLGLSNKI